MVYTRRRKCSDFSPPKPTCYTKDQLLGLAKDWNSAHPKNKITSITRMNKQNLWVELQKKHGTYHEDQWIRRSKKTRKNPRPYEAAFLPKVPAGWNANIDDEKNWLSSEDINRVMHAYEKQFRKFNFAEIVPIDFGTKTLTGKCAFIESNLCNEKYANLAKKYTTFAIVFNTDTHDGPGQHWISMFVDFKKGEICYFDSVGDAPPTQVKKLIERLQKEGNAHHKRPVKVFINKTRHQLKNTECGIYCLVFVRHMLMNGDFNQFSNYRLADEDAFKYRSYFFDDLHGVYDHV